MGYEYTYITTNGALMNEQRMKKLVIAGIDSVKFSINAANKNTCILTHGRDDFDMVYENLKRLFEYRKICGRSFKIFVSSA